MRVIYRKILCVTIIAVIFMVKAADVFSQDANLTFETYTMSDGLSNNTITAIFQDSKGFIWIGTPSGLNRFDGRTFVLFKHDPLNRNSISSNSINGINEDKKGNIWIATDYGLNVYNPNNGRFKVYLRDEKNVNTIRNNNVFNVFVDSKGIVWIKTLRFLEKLDPRNNIVKHYEHYFDIFNSNPEHVNYPIFEDSQGLIWVATNDGLNYFDTEFEQFVRFESNDKSSTALPNNQVRCIYENKHHELWIGTSNGFCRFNRIKKTFESYYYLGSNRGKNIVNGIVEDDNNNLWLATEQYGLVKFDLTRKEYTFFKQNGQTKNTVANNNVYRIISDQSGILWIGTRSGLSKIDSKKRKFNLYRNELFSDYKLQGNDISCVLADYNEDIFLGTKNDGITVINRLKKTTKYYNIANKKSKDDAVYSLSYINKRNIVAGTESGLLILNRKKDVFEPFFTKQNCKNENLLKPLRVKDVIEDRKGNLWIGTNQGIFKYNLITQNVSTYVHYQSNPHTISSNEINVIYENKSGDIWVGTSSGLSKYNEKTNDFTRYGTLTKQKRSLSNQTIFSLLEDENGILWIGTDAGLNKYNTKTDTFACINERNGLPNDQILCMLKEGSNLWLSTNKGVVRYSTNTGKMRAYNLNDGLQGFEFNPNSGCISPRGELFFGGGNGLNSFFPNSMEDNMKVPNIVITSFVTYNNSGKSIHVINDKNEVFLHSDSRTFTIEFAALEYTLPNQNKYKYCMEGLENKWITVDNRNYASFSNVPSGEYVFHVKGSNSDEVWNEKGARLHIIIETPIWKNKWTYVAYFVFLLFIIYSFIEMRTRSLRRANKILHEKELASIEIAKQKEEVSIKNKNIMDSITYAQRIQLAIMPSISKFKRLIPESFILYKPKDIVSGDFYWITEIGDKLFIAAVDCTGHGVPGAFMSIIGYDLLRNITKERGIHRPSEVLDQLNKSLIELLTKNNVAVGEVKDGMDISLCVFHKSKGVLEYSGALNPLYIIRDNKINTVKGDRYSVGLGNEHLDENFKNHIIKLEIGDRLYIFSDGYSDQFGGPEGKKMKFRRFRHLLLSIHDYPFDQQQKFLEEHFISWMGPHEQVDDILIMGMSFDYYLEQIPEEELGNA